MKTTEHNLAKITEGIAPAFDALKAACLKRLKAQAEYVRSTLEKNDWDCNAAFPYPRAFGANQRDYHEMKRDCELASSLTVTDPDKPSSFGIPGKPRYVMMRDGLNERFEIEATEYARMFIDAFAAKLTGKVAKEDKTFTIEAVAYSGTADPFANSTLTVSGPQGTMTWKTKCILNVSKLGKLFNQWPTRKQK